MSQWRRITYWFGGWVFDFTKLVTLLAFFGLIIHYFFYTILIVKGESMEPNYHDGDIMVVNRIIYRSHQPERGEVISLFFPGEIDKKFIKRIVALPEEKFSIVSGLVKINNRQIQESYLIQTATRPDMELKVDANEYIVLGDNREVSSDSRIWGTLPADYIIGKVEQKLGNTNELAKRLKNIF